MRAINRDLARKPQTPFVGQAKAWWYEWKKPLGRPECPYAYRWVLGCPWFSIRLHWWLASDDNRALHDHPSWFITCVLKGGYQDVTETGSEPMKVGTIRFRPALHKHTVQVNKGGCWTLCIFGKETRHWGFWVRGKFRKMNRYFFEFGHHPCEQ